MKVEFFQNGWFFALIFIAICMIFSSFDLNSNLVHLYFEFEFKFHSNAKIRMKNRIKFKFQSGV